MSALSKPPADPLWVNLVDQARVMQKAEPSLAKLLSLIILERRDFSTALSYVLANELADVGLDAVDLRYMIEEVLTLDPKISSASCRDLEAIVERDPAARSLLEPFLFYKGYHALQSYRIAHHMWGKGRQALALYLQSRSARRFSVDIHPAAVLGQGVMFDHANGIVIGETAVVEDNVSFLHSVTLGGTGKEIGDRHPKIRSGVMIGAGAKILGNIEIGSCSRVAAGSVVLENVPSNVTVAGVPAKIVGVSGCDQPALGMHQFFKI